MKLRPHKWADAQVAAPSKLQALLHALASFADSDGIAFPSQEKICSRLGWSKGTVKKWSDVGRALGLFSTRKRFNPRKGHVDAMFYTLHLDRVVTAEEVGTQIAELRFPSPEGKSQKQGFPSDPKTAASCRTEIATGGKQLQSKKELTSGALDVSPNPPNQKRDWLLVGEGSFGVPPRSRQ